MIKNILSIGQNKAMNYLLETVLSRQYQLYLAEDVFKGMHVLKTKQGIHLVVIDVDYQTKEGIDFIFHINSSKIYKKPLIVLSSIQNKKIDEFKMEGNVYDHFIKPFSPMMLLNSIDRLTVSRSLSQTSKQ
jgi:two-component system, chemotaxis family, chemotaxis protein CheY